MEVILYRRVWINITAKFVTHCPYRRGLLVGSHSCFFCKHCKGRTEDTVRCGFSDSCKPKPKDYVSVDVMVKGEWRKTIKVKPTGLIIIDGSMMKKLTEEDIRNAVKEHCPYTYRVEKWNVEFNK